MVKGYVEVAERQCSECRLVKPRAEFHKDKSSKYGIQHRCKACMNARSQRYAETHRDYFKQKGREKYDPSKNGERYELYREDYLERRRKQSTTIEGRLLGLFNVAKGRAAHSGIPFSITLESLLDLYKAQEGKCRLTGILLTLDVNPDGSRNYMPFSPSLDQIKPGGGYTPENTRLVCVAVNLALNRFGEDVLEQVCRGFLAHRELEGRTECSFVDVSTLTEPERVETHVITPPLVGEKF
jgi:hypothetical protein